MEQNLEPLISIFFLYQMRVTMTFEIYISFPYKFHINKTRDTSHSLLLVVTLLLLFKQISIHPELSSRPDFRIQGGYPKRDGWKERGQMEILVINIGCILALFLYLPLALVLELFVCCVQPSHQINGTPMGRGHIVQGQTLKYKYY